MRLCRVWIEEGSVNGPTEKERLVLSEKELQKGLRLACQVLPEGDLQIRIGHPPPAEAGWQKLDFDSMTEKVFPAGVSRKPEALPVVSANSAYGVAVDLGTTNISLTLWDLKQGRRLSGRFGANRQFYFGSDVMTRLVAASRSVEIAREVIGAVRHSIMDALKDLCSGEGWDPKKIRQMTVVGNTPMLALLAGKNFDLLLRPEYWSGEVDCLPEDTRGWFGSAVLNPETAVDIVQPLAGFVGSDLVAGVLATHLTKQGPGSLLIDFGTNSEIALWDGSDLWTTSAAGGPAFEVGGMRCGMPAESGAVFKIDYADGPETGCAGPFVGVIGGGESKGLCGSGMVDAVAWLLKTGRLNDKGKLIPEASKAFPEISGELSGLLPDGRDIDLFQRAKAAIGAGVGILLERARLRVSDLRRICVGGTFGRYLNLQHAQEIGLLPAASRECFELCGNTALAGCERLLLSADGKEELKALRKRAKLINLARVPEFEDRFLENLYLRPMKED